MKNDYDVLMEAKLKRSVQKALKQLLEDIENEPTLVVEIEDCGIGDDDRSLEDIREWLFKRR